jgi:predicted transcriptional regulator
MAQAKLSKLELEIMQVLWTHGASSIREIQERLTTGKKEPAYSTVQTMVYRLETKNAVRRAKKISNAHIFEAVISRSSQQRRLVSDVLDLFGGRMQPFMAHLIETGMLTLDDVHEAERALQDLVKKKQQK